MPSIFSAFKDRPRFVDVRKANISDDLRGLCEFYGEDMCALLCVKNTPENFTYHFLLETPYKPEAKISGFPGGDKDHVEQWLAEQRDKQANKEALQFWAEVAILVFVGVEMLLEIFASLRASPSH